MAGVRYEIELSDVDLERAIAQAVDMVRSEPLMEELAAAMRAQTRDRFRDETGPDGEAWTQSRRAADENGKTLQDERRLYKSIVTDASPLRATIGTNLVYSAIHQLGGKTGRNESVDMPARPYLGMSRDDARELEDLVFDHIRRRAA